MAKKTANDAEASPAASGPGAPSPGAGAPGFARGTSQRWGADRLELLKSLKSEEEGDAHPGGADVSDPASGARALGDFAPGVELPTTAADLGAEPNAMFNGLPSPAPIAPEPAGEGAFAAPGPGSPHAPADALGSSEAPAPRSGGNKFDPTLALRKLKEAIREQKELQRQQTRSRPQAAAPGPAPAPAQAPTQAPPRPPHKPTGRPPEPFAEARVGPADSLSSGSQREPGDIGRIAPEGRPVEPRRPPETAFDSWQGSDAQESDARKRDGAPEAGAPNRETPAQTEPQAAQSAAPGDGDEPPVRRERAGPKDIPADLPGSGREAMGAKRARPAPAIPADGEPKGAPKRPSAVGFESGEARGGSKEAGQGAAGAKPDGAKEKGAARESRAFSQDGERASRDRPQQKRELAGFAGSQNGGEESAPIPSAGPGASAQAQSEAERAAGGFAARPEAEPRDVFPEIEAARAQVAEIAGDAWRLAKLLERVERKLQGADRDRCRIRREDCLNKLKRSLADFGVRLIDLEGRDYEAGVAIEPVGMDRFPGRRDWVIEAMIEPIVMGPKGLIKQGVARVKPKESDETETPRNDGDGD